MIYSLSYELKSQEKDYTELFTYLEHGLGKGEGIHVLRDSWWIASEEEIDVDQECDEIRKRMGEKDHFFFSRLTDKDINGWLPSSSWNYYNENKQKINQ